MVLRLGLALVFPVANLPFHCTLLSMLSPFAASWVDLDIGDSLFGEKDQARLLAGEQSLLLVCSDKLTLCKP